MKLANLSPKQKKTMARYWQGVIDRTLSGESTLFKNPVLVKTDPKYLKILERCYVTPYKRAFEQIEGSYAS